MADVLARAGIGSGLETQRYSEEREDEIRDDLERDEGTVRAKSTESTVHERPSVPRGPFDFSGCSSDTHPKYPKRPRSSSFDETALPSPSGFGSKASGNSTLESPLAPPRRGSIDISSTVYPMAKSGTSLLASSESTPTASGASNAKRA
ncbi:uncharacterized protein FOMMEDRAFT_16800, partial [Fomitiporia mediterranea MF3/22]|uniref:uncharacterized protein n=1 Tax=Fomitiporia mediterranea (strain MF3/22) TaxID=694068 RepID=UPI0004407F1C